MADSEGDDEEDYDQGDYRGRTVEWENFMHSLRHFPDRREHPVYKELCAKYKISLAFHLYRTSVYASSEHSLNACFIIKNLLDRPLFIRLYDSFERSKADRWFSRLEMYAEFLCLMAEEDEMACGKILYKELVICSLKTGRAWEHFKKMFTQRFTNPDKDEGPITLATVAEVLLQYGRATWTRFINLYVKPTVAESRYKHGNLPVLMAEFFGEYYKSADKKTKLFGYLFCSALHPFLPNLGTGEV